MGRDGRAERSVYTASKHAVLGLTKTAALDGRAFDMNRIDQQVRLGDIEIWEVRGEMMAHPFHIHGVRFQVLRRGGRAAGSEDQGWRDTVMVEDPVELLVQFTQPARSAPFMYHCHILDHEDLGMMGTLQIAAPAL